MIFFAKSAQDTSDQILFVRCFHHHPFTVGFCWEMLHGWRVFHLGRWILKPTLIYRWELTYLTLGKRNIIFKMDGFWGDKISVLEGNSWLVTKMLSFGHEKYFTRPLKQIPCRTRSEWSLAQWPWTIITSRYKYWTLVMRGMNLFKAALQIQWKQSGSSRRHHSFMVVFSSNKPIANLIILGVQHYKHPGCVEYWHKRNMLPIRFLWQKGRSRTPLVRNIQLKPAKRGDTNISWPSFLRLILHASSIEKKQTQVYRHNSQNHLNLHLN